MVDHAGLEEGRAEDRRVRDLAAEPAADAGLVHVRDRILAQRIGIVLEGERGAAVEAHAGLVARAHVRVDAEARRHHPPPRLETGRDLRLDPALALELALGAGDDDLEPARRRGHGFLHRLERLAHPVGIDDAHPRDAEAPDRKSTRLNSSHGYISY